PGAAAHRGAPGALADGIRDRAVRAVTADGPVSEETAWACEAAVRLTLSYVIAPVASDEDAAAHVARLVRALEGDGSVGRGL
ncbi:TetR/AcrR family transcriptional regulator, partial [Streptomyces sp. ISL-11]|nr:TetR/AcrR family transcriptional regulator [Streptomyces sp. ISL-11]